ncbi:uncharacterized protein LOC131947957 isoform X2 [Physella acuta]|nr:uncharacterized protein LOC131947957 isoform X2 [Physella acuta]XP_059165351.1 uncharacterized protein LOC131947957 isoform X2 [Physella acuta]
MTDNKLKPNRAFSAKGRLEGHISDNSSSKLSNKSTVVNLYCDFNCANITKPSTTKVELKKQDSKKHPSSQAFFQQDSVPTSQKNQIYINNTKLIQPTICGLTAETKDTNIELQIVHTKSQNGSLHTDLNPRIENSWNKKYEITSDICHRELPSTLKPLIPWIRHQACSKLVGIDPLKCKVFLSHEYDSEDLQVLPDAQRASDDLPYICCVETPRKQVFREYPKLESKPMNIRPENKRETVENDPHIKTSVPRGIAQIKLEIEEMENLMKGIGSLNGHCSFVQFQAEIQNAQEMAKSLIKFSPRTEVLDPTDHFGLLKLYKDHEEIMKILIERRNKCLHELHQLQQNLEETNVKFV